MSLKNPKPGAFSVGHYQVSAMPWLTQSNWKTGNSNTTETGTYRIDFPTVTRFIRVANKATTTATLNVGFTLHGIKVASGTNGGDHIGNHFISISESDSVQFDIRCTQLFLSGANGMDGQTYDILAGLTEIPGNMMSLSASNGGAQSGAG